MRRTQRDRGQEYGQEKDQVFLKLIEANAPYEERQRALLDLEKRWLRKAATEAEREQLRRGIAEDLVTLAYSFNKPWAEFGKWLRRVQRLLLQSRDARPYRMSIRAVASPLSPAGPRGVDDVGRHGAQGAQTPSGKSPPRGTPGSHRAHEEGGPRPASVSMTRSHSWEELLPRSRTTSSRSWPAPRK